MIPKKTFIKLESPKNSTLGLPAPLMKKIKLEKYCNFHIKFKKILRNSYLFFLYNLFFYNRVYILFIIRIL